MKIKDYPVLILAAGRGERIGKITEQNKTLIEIDKKKHIKILDLLLFNLISSGVRNIIIITGYQGENIRIYLEDLILHIDSRTFFTPILSEFKATNINCIEANSDYIRGPLYTLMTINKYRNPFFENAKPNDSYDEMVQMLIFKKTLEQIKDYQLFTVIPADTIFNIDMLQSLFSLEFEGENKGKDNHQIQSSFSSTLTLSQSERFGLAAVIYKIKSGEISFKSHGTDIDTRDIQLPIISILPRFLDYCETLRMTEISKVVDALNEFLKIDERNSIITKYIEFKGSNPPLFDIDTKEDLLDIQDRYFSFHKL